MYPWKLAFTMLEICNKSKHLPKDIKRVHENSNIVYTVTLLGVFFLLDVFLLF